MILFLDIEASGLGSGSFPIEIAWVGEEGNGESHLIRPAPGWTQWSAKAEALHGISRTRLEAEGLDHREVARRAAAAFARARSLVSDAPDWDQHWLDMLAHAAGTNRLAQVISVQQALALATVSARAAEVIAMPTERGHRALEDVLALRRAFQDAAGLSDNPA